MSDIMKDLADTARRCAARQLKSTGDADNHLKVLKLIAAVAEFDGRINDETAYWLEELLQMHIAVSISVADREGEDQ